jgi:hypothetical protein
MFHSVSDIRSSGLTGGKSLFGRGEGGFDAAEVACAPMAEMGWAETSPGASELSLDVRHCDFGYLWKYHNGGNFVVGVIGDVGSLVGRKKKVTGNFGGGLACQAPIHCSKPGLDPTSPLSI